MSESERGSQLLRANPTKQIKIQGDTDERKFLLVAGRVGGEAVPSFTPNTFFTLNFSLLQKSGVRR